MRKRGSDSLIPVWTSMKRMIPLGAICRRCYLAEEKNKIGVASISTFIDYRDVERQRALL